MREAGEQESHTKGHKLSVEKKERFTDKSSVSPEKEQKAGGLSRNLISELYTHNERTEETGGEPQTYLVKLRIAQSIAIESPGMSHTASHVTADCSHQKRARHIAGARDALRKG
ncbi:hypothetical protein PoB_000069900 [Plakobranchus ocellatus]|uniref:Uncharacterized protein n=1 Tax=Plakobranchus ocellatus TaxID=259542 RepID=A0AAV3XW91_9GAST|nr:hypothetical protein PoB_000069900 [Plakobranchus ocellatus]